MNSIEVFLKILDLGVIDGFCVGAGSRNAPLIFEIHRQKQVPSFSFVDERAAGFFALGRAKASPSKWSAVCTTSGTAVAELLPAVIEAHYQKLPLLVCSADRPPEFRGSGAPQSIEHMGIFSSYVQASFDFANTTEKDKMEKLQSLLAQGLKKGPVHLNFCLEEFQGRAKS